MNLSALTAISPIDGRYSRKTEQLRSIFSEYGLIKQRVYIELMWFKALLTQPELSQTIDSAAQNILTQLIDNFSEADAQAIKKIEQTTNHDVKAVEYYLKEKLGQYDQFKDKLEFIHFGATSEDINNLAYALMLKAGREQCLLPLQTEVINLLKDLTRQTASIALLARTHGQAASPTTIGKELANVIVRLQRQMQQLRDVTLMGKMNGAVGNYNAHIVTYPEIDWPLLTSQFIQDLGLYPNEYTTQIEPHDYIAEYCDAVARFNTILMDLDRDIWSYISLDYFKQKLKAGEVGSSTMPHKVNPIDFENSEGNLGIANALLNHFSQKLPISRWQRDLTDSTVLRNLGVAMAHCQIAYRACITGLEKLEINQAALEQALEANWQVLAEAIQMELRRLGHDEPYEKLKSLTRGKVIDKAMIKSFIDQLELPAESKARLLDLEPKNYIGLAEKLALQLLDDYT